jgi:hypothetical protein
MKATALRYGSLLLLFAIVLLGVLAYHLRASADDDLPRVQMNVDNVSPRPIEDLTSKSVPRDYALAWQTLAQALSSNKTGLLDGYFTGLAKQDFAQRINSQIKSGMQTRCTDRGHKLEALFYSPAGDVMELRDHAQFDVQILDGGKVIYEEPINAQFMVLMTPGADRWLVRQLQATNGEKP